MIELTLGDVVGLVLAGAGLGFIVTHWAMSR